MKYIIKTKNDRVNQVNVLKQTGKDKYSLEWVFDLKKDTEPIVLSEMFNEDCFVIANWNAWIRIYSLSKKDILFEKKYDAGINSIVKISTDKTKLFVSYRTPDYQSVFEVISLTSFSTLKTIELPKDVQTKHFTLGPKDRILFYYSDIDINTCHGYHVLDLKDEKLTYFPMKYPQWDQFEICPPVLSPENNIGIMPLWDDIEIKKNEEGNPLFVLSIMMFDLDRFEMIKHIPVREFSVGQLGCHDSDSNDIAEKIVSCDKEDEEYKEAVAEFITENLYSIYFDDNKSFWIGFRGGIVRNISFNGKLSPLFVASSIPYSTSKGIFNFPMFHSYIDSVKQDAIILTEDEAYYRMAYSQDEVVSDQEIIAKEVLDIKPTVIASEKQNVVVEEMGKVNIEVSNLNLESSYLDALDKIINLTTAIDEIKSGDTLLFRIKDNQRFEEDEIFFKNAVQIAGSAEKIAQIIKNFIAYKGAGRLYCDPEATALAHAVYYLTSTNENYIDLAIQYLSVIDFEHDVFNKERLIPMFRDKYHEKFGKHIVEQLSKLDDGEGWLEGY